MTLKRVVLSALWILVVSFIVSGLFSIAQELLITTMIPNTIAGEVGNRSFCFALGVAFVMSWIQLSAWYDEFHKQIPAKDSVI